MEFPLHWLANEGHVMRFQHRGPRLAVLVDDGYPNFGESAIQRRCISLIKRRTCGFGKVAIDAALERCQAPEKL